MLIDDCSTRPRITFIPEMLATPVPQSRPLSAIVIRPR
jgi:hypothetical protein